MSNTKGLISHNSVTLQPQGYRVIEKCYFSLCRTQQSNISRACRYQADGVRFLKDEAPAYGDMREKFPIELLEQYSYNEYGPNAKLATT